MSARNFLSLLTFLCVSFSIAHAQSVSIAGTVKDGDSNEPLIGATVAVENTSEGSVTDLDGKYSITNLPAGTYTLKTSYVGYVGKEISGVEVKAGQVTTMNITMSVTKANTLLEVVVTAEARKENIASLLVARKNSAVVSDAISADMIKKSPDKNTSDVLKRVSGVTIQENKFVVVRGMNDRYNDAMLNGSMLPSSEPDRKTFAFDIFPAALVDNITIIKSATPDLPGDFSGGLVQINTKEIPDQNFVSLKIGESYNSISTFKPYYAYHGGRTDWLGIDDGTRAIPNSFPSHSEYTPLPQGSDAQIADDKLFANNWPYFKKNSSPLNPALELAGGFKAGKKSSFGGIFGITYNSSRKQTPIERFDYYGHSDYNDDTIYKYNDTAYNRSILSSALADLAFKINANNKISLNNLYSINSSDQTVLRNGYSWSQGSFIRSNSFYFVSNKIFNSQLSGEHFITKLKLKIKWDGYITSMRRDEPDYRRNLYQSFDGTSPYFCVLSSSPSTNIGAGIQYFGKINDDAQGANVDLSEPFLLFKQQQIVKAGVAFYNDQRTRDARVLTVIENNPGSINQNIIFYGQDSIFDPANFNASTFVMAEDKTSTNHYDGSIQNADGYLMLDNKFTNFLRLAWGVRLENYHQVLNTFASNLTPFVIDTIYHDLLPSANLIISVLKDANLRFTFDRSVARPSYRELANSPFYDFLLNVTYYGNPALVETHITSYEMRWEHYFPNAQYYSVSTFYKKFLNPIEEKSQGPPGPDSRTLIFVNAPSATNIGVEIEGRKNFSFLGAGWENLYAYFNLALIKSKVTSTSIESPDTTSTRPLQGQSPFVTNASLQYTEPKTKLGVSVLFNYVGHRLAQVGDITDEPVWQQVHPTLDLKVSKSFLKNGLVEVTWNDILHGNDVLYYDLNRNGTFQNTQPTDYSKGDRVVALQHFGYNLSLAMSYKF